jgi:type IV pilus assembly protein PilB
VLVTGPTGSGKSTTLYAALNEINEPQRNIITIEDPVEYQLPGVNQLQVNMKAGLTFAGGLRAMLRADPDVIMVGEIRDGETAKIAIESALTGHLVLSTLHTNDAPSTVNRLLKMGVEPFLVASSVNLIMAQRLARRVCQSCGTSADQPDEVVQALHVPAKHPGYRKGDGCPTCRHSGYAGRVGIYEIVPISGPIARLIESGAPESGVRQQARTEGFSTLTNDAMQKLTTGMTTGEDILRVVQIASAEHRCETCRKSYAEGQATCPHCGTAIVSVPTGSEPASFATTTSTSAEATPMPRRNFKALVVDDIRNIVRAVLQSANLGLQVVTAQDGIEAVELASQERPDIVILDISMPDMDGFEVCRRLRADVRTAFVPVLMLTANGGEQHMTAGFGAGADDYVVKPFRRDELVARVRRMLERSYGKDAIPSTPPPTQKRGAGATIADER